MSVEVLNSAIMQLKGKAHEIYGLMKDIYRRPSQEGDADQIMNLSVKLAQLEGGILTLEQYASEIVKSVAAEATAIEAALAEELEHPEVVDENPGPSHAELMERSPTYKKSVDEQKQKITKIPAKKKARRKS